MKLHRIWGTIHFSFIGACVVGIATTLPSIAGCKDDAKASAQKAADQASAAEKLNEEDVAKISQGLAAGAKLFAPLFANGGDPHADPQEVRAILFRARRDVPQLNGAKTTFSALADDHGIGIRNDLSEDAMAGANLFAAFPNLKNAKDGFVATNGAFQPAPPPAPVDRQWIGAAPVNKPDGSLGGYYLTGWTYRQYAFQLQDELKQKMNEAHPGAKLPVFYVMLFDANSAYGAPMTPDVNEIGVRDLDLVKKTASGPSQGVVAISDRDFGYAATRAPSLGAEIGIVVLRSEL